MFDDPLYCAFSEALLDLGWRVPFLISILLVGIGLYIRLSLVETPVFRQLKLKDEVATIPVMEVQSRHRRPIGEDSFSTLLINRSRIRAVFGVFRIGRIALIGPFAGSVRTIRFLPAGEHATTAGDAGCTGALPNQKGNRKQENDKNEQKRRPAFSLS